MRHLMHCEDCEPPLHEVEGKEARRLSMERGFSDVTSIEKYEVAFLQQERKNKGSRQQLKEEVQHGRDLAQKYRPKRIADMWGQYAATNSVEVMLGTKARPHSFIFSGPSGVGKTTLARLLAAELGAGHNVIEIDAATNTGVDAMRDILSGAIYNGFGAVTKFYLIDEAHMLSKAAWNSMLKTLEEPPNHAYFAICTTEPEKIPSTVLTRCAHYKLGPVKADDLFEMLKEIAGDERLDVSEGTIKKVVRAAGGSPRNAINLFQKVIGVEDKHVDELLEGCDENGSAAVIDLARALVNGKLTWPSLTSILRDLDGQSPEGIRIVVVNFVSACLMKATSDKQVVHLLNVLDAFSKPYNTADKMAPVLLSFGNIIFK